MVNKVSEELWEKVRDIKVSVFALPERALVQYLEYDKNKNFMEGKLMVKFKIPAAKAVIIDRLEKDFVVTETLGTDDIIIEYKPVNA